VCGKAPSRGASLSERQQFRNGEVSSVCDAPERDAVRGALRRSARDVAEGTALLAGRELVIALWIDGSKEKSCSVFTVLTGFGGQFSASRARF
jgi:hypothetical protein